VIKLASSLVIEGNDNIGRGFEIISTDAAAWITLRIDRREFATAIAEYPDGTSAGSVENYVVLLAATVIIEGEGAVRSGFEIIPSDTVPGITLLIDGGELSTLVSYDPDSASARPVEDDVVKLATAVVIESEGAIIGRFEVIPSDTVPGISLGIDW
jgi:F420-0:gamma-glutamyl ligase